MCVLLMFVCVFVVVYYLVHNTPTRGKTEEWTLKAAVGVRR